MGGLTYEKTLGINCVNTYNGCLSSTKWMQWATNQCFRSSSRQTTSTSSSKWVKEGEQVRIVFHNKLPEDSVIHWHGLHVPNEMDGVPGVTQDAVKPGESFVVYEFTAKPAGTHMYHTHANTLKQVGKGLFGTFIVDKRGEKRL